MTISFRCPCGQYITARIQWMTPSRQAVITCPACGTQHVRKVSSPRPAPLHPDPTEVDKQIRQRLGQRYDEIRRARESAPQREQQ